MSNQQFQLFSNPSSDVSRLLLAHFVTVELLLTPILGREWQGRLLSTPMDGMFDWLDLIYCQVAPEMRSYLDWPSGTVTIIKAEMSGERPKRPWLKSYFRNRASVAAPMLSGDYQGVKAPFFTSV
jgi:hypothetical protein